MAFIEWNNGYSVGIANIDKEHQKLAGYINELHEAMLQQKSKNVLLDILGKLVTYTQTHFKNEEDLFAKHDYPGARMHIVEHKELTSKVLAFKQDVESGKAFITVAIFDFLKNWLIGHINKSDKAYGPYLNSKGVK